MLCSSSVLSSYYAIKRSDRFVRFNICNVELLLLLLWAMWTISAMLNYHCGRSMSYFLSSPGTTPEPYYHVVTMEASCAFVLGPKGVFSNLTFD